MTRSAIFSSSAILLVAGAASAQQWTSLSDTNFNLGANWSTGLVPNATDVNANFTSASAVARTLDVASSVVVNQLNFSTTSYSFTTANNSGITLAGDNAALTFTNAAVALTQDLAGITLTAASASTRIGLFSPNQNVQPMLVLGNAVVDSGAELVFTRTHNTANNRIAHINLSGTLAADGEVAVRQVGTNGQGTLNFRVQSFTGNGGLTVTGGGTATNVTVTSYESSGALTIFNAGTTTTLGTLTSDAAIHLHAGTLHFNGALGGTGAISVSSGLLRFNAAAPVTINRDLNILTAPGGNIEIRNASNVAANKLTFNGNVSNDGAEAGLRRITLGGQNGGFNFLNSTLTDGATGNTLGLIRDGSTSGAANGGAWYLGGNNSFSGGITIDSAVLGFSSAANLGAASNVITLGSIITNTASSLTLSDAAAPVTLANVLRLVGANSAGAVIRNNSGLAASTLLIDSSASIEVDSETSRVLTVGGTNAGRNEIAATLGNGVSGTQLSIAKIEAGNWVLSGPTTYGGNTTISGGTLAFTGAAALPTSGNLLLTGGGVIGLSGTHTVRVGLNSGQTRWSGSGGLAAVGGDLTITLDTDGDLGTLDGLSWVQSNTTAGYVAGQLFGAGVANSLVLGSTIADGRLEITNSIDLNSANTGGGGLRWITVVDNPNSAADVAVLSGVVYGANQFVKNGDGKLILTGANAFTGTMHILGGVLQIGNGGAVGILTSTNVVNNGVLVFKRSDDVGFNGTVSGTGSLTHDGSGQVSFNRNNTYTGLTTIGAAATLRLGNGGGAGGIADSVEVVNSGTLTINRNNDYVHNGPIRGNGRFIQAGVGTTTLGGDNSYSGPTSIAAGSLLVTGTLGNTAVTVASGAAFELLGAYTGGDVTGLAGATLNLSGTVAGRVTSAADLNVAGIGQVGTARFAALILDGGSLHFDLAAIGAGDSIVLTGGAAPLVNANTTLNFSNSGIGIGTYSLISGFGANMLAEEDFGRLILGRTTLGAFDLSLANNAGSLDLIVSSSAPTLVWTGAATNAWNMTDANFAGAATVYSDGSLVTFTAGTATNNIVVDAAGIAPAGVIVDAATSETFTFSGGAITGTTPLTKQGDGLVVFTNNNTFTGGVQVLDGILRLGNGGTTGQLDLNSTITLSNASLLQLDRNNTVTLSGAITGSGGVEQRGTGIVELAGGNTYENGTTVSGGGTLRTVDLGVLPGSALVNVIDGTLELQGAASQTLSAGLSLGGGTAGSHSVVSIGVGLSLGLAGPSSEIAYTGTVDDGAIIGGFGTLVSGTSGRTINVVDGAAAHDLTITAILSTTGSNNIGGAFRKTGDGALYLPLSNATTLTSINTLSAGTIVVGDNGSLGTNSLIVGGAATLAGDGDDLTIANLISIQNTIPNLTIAGPSALTFNRVQTVGAATTLNIVSSGLTTITSLTSGGGNNNSGLATISGTGDAAIYNLLRGPGTNPDRVAFNGPGTYHLLGASTLSGGINVVDGTILLGHDNATGTDGSTINLGSAAGGVAPRLLTDAEIVVAAPINVVNGAGSELTLGGNSAVTSTFAGLVTLNQDVRLSATAGGTVVFANDLVGGTGAPGLTKIGAGTVVLAGGANSYTGATSVAAGTLQVEGALGATPVTVAAGAALTGGGTLGGPVDVLAGGSFAGTATVAGVVTSSGTLTPGGATVGQLTLANLVLAGGMINFQLDLIGASDRIALTGGSAPTVNASATLSFAALSNFGLGTYNLISGYSGTIANFHLLSNPSTLGAFNLALQNNDGSLDLVVTSGGGGPANLTWSGGTGAWGADPNFGGSAFNDGDHVTFGNGATTTSVAVQAAGVSPGSVVINNDGAHPYSFTGGGITGTGGVTKTGGGSVDFANVNTYSGGTSVLGGLVNIVSGGAISSVGNITVSEGTLDVHVGGAVGAGGTTFVNRAGTLVADGNVGGSIVVNDGGLLQGSGMVGEVTIRDGGGYSPGNSIESTGPSNADLTLDGGANLYFEFRNADGNGPGTDWDLIDLGTGVLNINASAVDPIVVRIDSWKFDNSGHGGGTADGPNTNGFDDAEEYHWKFIAASSIRVSSPTDDDFGRRFEVVDDELGFGVFGDGNPFNRPETSLGRGTFRVVQGDFGGQGHGLYVHYSAVPEPGTILLVSLSAAGFYVARRRRAHEVEEPAISTEE